MKTVIQENVIEWIRSQGTWAVMFLGLVIWAKPHADNLIDAHIALIRSLQQNQDTISKAIVELKDLFREAQLLRDSVDKQTQAMDRDRSHITTTQP